MRATSKKRAARIISKLREIYGEKASVDEIVTNTLVDLRHVCREAGIKYYDRDSMASRHYTSESNRRGQS